MGKRLKLLLKERAMVEELRLLPEQAKLLILNKYDNEIKLITEGVVEDAEDDEA